MVLATPVELVPYLLNCTQRASNKSDIFPGTDEGDLKFNYLSSFGPRFRKLADMYGEVPSDEDESQAPGEESWC